MLKRQFKFIICLCLIAVLVWILGEVLIGLVLEWHGIVSWIWAGIMLVGTCVFSVWKCPRE
ncbi:MAG: hypothetical protein J6B17_00730 [Ruminococcus sp.]|jgi:hypothetical protein|nr:hypothetical protein [Ruminococcus sp.]MBQ8724483.1 hypothetical protein [Oscillospiraceae bacterium]